MTLENMYRLEEEVVNLLCKACWRMCPYGLKAIKVTREVYDMVFRRGDRWREQYGFDFLECEPLFLHAGGKDIRLIPDCERLELVF